MSDKSKTLEVGDEVWYLPHQCHAFNHNPNNEYAWAIGLRKNPHYEKNADTGEDELVEDVIEVEEGYLDRVVLPSINRSSNPKEARKQLVPLRPKNPWKAKVTQVNGDGTVDLEIESGGWPGMVTLGYKNVLVDEARLTHHSCHRKGGA